LAIFSDNREAFSQKQTRARELTVSGRRTEHEKQPLHSGVEGPAQTEGHGSQRCNLW